MAELGVWIGLALGAVLFFYIVKWSWLFLREIWTIVSEPPRSHAKPKPQRDSDELDGMNPGDYYNGPGGYDATGGYQEGPYGRD